MRLEIGGKPKNGRKKNKQSTSRSMGFSWSKIFPTETRLFVVTCMIRSMIRAWIVLIEINV